MLTAENRNPAAPARLELVGACGIRCAELRRSRAATRGRRESSCVNDTISRARFYANPRQERYGKCGSPIPDIDQDDLTLFPLKMSWRVSGNRWRELIL